MHSLVAYKRRITLGLIECLVYGYQAALAPLLVGGCKFYPSCSNYFLEAVRQWGVLRGSWLGFKRILRCHPFTAGGIDPVPPR